MDKDAIGWLTPEGRFYACDYGGHLELLDSLTYTEGDVENAGWIKVQRYAGETQFYLSEKKRATKAQRDVIVKYCVGRPLPYFLEADEERL